MNTHPTTLPSIEADYAAVRQTLDELTKALRDIAALDPADGGYFFGVHALQDCFNHAHRLAIETLERTGLQL